MERAHAELLRQFLQVRARIQIALNVPANLLEPLRSPGQLQRFASQARTIARLLRLLRRLEELDVLPERPPRRTRRLAEDARCFHRDKEGAIEPAVAPDHRLPGAFHLTLRH